MNFNILFKTSTSLVIELDNKTCVETKDPYTILVNGVIREVQVTKNVYSLYELTPGQTYQISLLNEETNEITTKEVVMNNEALCLNVKRFNAKGDGVSDDTQAIQAAIMACPDFGRVYIPAGTYAVKSIFLKSNLTLEFEKGAKLTYQVEPGTGAFLPGYTKTRNDDEYYLGSWEGNPLDTFTALIQGIHVTNVNLIGDRVYFKWFTRIM